MKLIQIVFIALVFVGCSKGEAPKPPEIARLTYPEKNSECTSGVTINATTSEVEFRWQMALHTDTYELRVTNLDNNSTQTISTKSLSVKLPLQKGVPFSWSVNTKNASLTQITPSETWQFYNAGFETTHVPFLAEIVTPKSGESIFRDINNEITLDWNGADIDNDIQFYEVYLSTVSPPATLLETLGGGTTSRKTSVTADTVYYWKVVTIDREGNKSDSGIYSFKVL